MPAANNTPGFVSFADYLNANGGSLQNERDQLLAQGDAAGQKLEGDLATWKQQAQAAGPGGGDVTTLPGASQFYTDQKGAQDLGKDLEAGGLGQGYGTFDAGLIGASTGYQGAVKALGDKYGSTLTDYLSQVQAAAQPAPSAPSAPQDTPSADDVNDGPEGLGPDVKPRRRPPVHGQSPDPEENIP